MEAVVVGHDGSSFDSPPPPFPSLIVRPPTPLLAVAVAAQVLTLDSSYDVVEAPDLPFPSPRAVR